MPEFIGGLDSLISFMISNINYPHWEKKNKIQGTIYVSFVIEKDGSVSHPEIIRTVKESIDFDKEVLRVVKMMPNWKPGENKMEKVAVKMTLPVKFTL